MPDFHGDLTKWEAWQLHLDAKFRTSAMLFPTEQSRIDYIQDHCKSTAFVINKARCRLGNENPYTKTHEILDLDNIYREFDPFGTTDARLHSPDFGMKEKTFNEFLAKFTAKLHHSSHRERRYPCEPQKCPGRSAPQRPQKVLPEGAFKKYFESIS